MDVIRLFEDFGPPEPDRREPGERTPVGRALGVVLSEIDEIAKATMSSITLATMLRLIERQNDLSDREYPARHARLTLPDAGRKLSNPKFGRGDSMCAHHVAGPIGTNDLRKKGNSCTSRNT